MSKITVTIDVEAEPSQIDETELSDIETAVEETLTEWGHKHDIATATVA